MYCSFNTVIYEALQLTSNTLRVTTKLLQLDGVNLPNICAAEENQEVTILLLEPSECFYILHLYSHTAHLREAAIMSFKVWCQWILQVL